MIITTYNSNLLITIKHICSIKTDVKNYLHISSLSVVLRILEKTARDKLLQYLKEQNKLYLNQSRFQTFSTTLKYLQYVNELWLKNSDEGS